MIGTVQTKIAIVTGGGSCIGLAFAEKFIQHQIHTIIVGRDEQKLSSAKKKGHRKKTIPESDEIEIAVERISKTQGGKVFAEEEEEDVVCFQWRANNIIIKTTGHKNLKPGKTYMLNIGWGLLQLFTKTGIAFW